MNKQTLIMFLIAHYEYGMESIEGMGYEQAYHSLFNENLHAGVCNVIEKEFMTDNEKMLWIDKYCYGNSPYWCWPIQRCYNLRQIKTSLKTRIKILYKELKTTY
jgi:hypothetical protein